MFFQKDASPRNGDSDFQNAVIGVDLRQSKHSDSGVTPSDHSWRTEGSELSREYSTGTSPDSHESNKETPSPKSPSHQLHSVKPQPSGRQRTSQACDKCRERKTKCSGHRPVCLRCTNRGLICEYTMRESRSRTPARSRVAVVSEIPQADYAGQGRPTPAHHSRNGGGRTNAFAPPTRSYTGTPATQTTSRPLLPNPSANSTTEPTVRNISVQQSHRPYQPRQLPDTSTSNPYSGHAPVASPNASYDTKGAWSLYDSSFDLNYSFELPSGDNDLFQPSHHSSSGHDERQTMHSALASISLPQSSLRFDYDLSSLLLPPTPASHRQHNFDERSGQAYSCSPNEDTSYYIPPYTKSTYFQGGFPDPMYHVNGNIDSTSTLSTTPMGSQLELACPTPSIPLNPAAFRDVGGTCGGSFEFNPPPEFRYTSPPLVNGGVDYFGC